MPRPSSPGAQGGNCLQPQQHYALRARGGSGHGSPAESALLFLKCVNSLFIGQECSHTTSSFPLAFSSQQPYAASGTDAVPFSSLSVPRTSSSSFSISPLVTQLHIHAPPSSVHPPHAYPHSPPNLASLSSGLGATETVTRNLNRDPDPPPLQGRGAPARDGQLDPFGQGSSPGHMLRAGWPAWHSPLPGKRSPVARPLGRATDPSLQLRRGSDVSLLTFMVTFQPLTGISVVTVSTFPVRAIGGLLLEMKSVLCTE